MWDFEKRSDILRGKVKMKANAKRLRQLLKGIARIKKKLLERKSKKTGIYIYMYIEPSTDSLYFFENVNKMC